MSCFGPTLTEEQKVQKKVDIQVEKELEKLEKQDQGELKILLLGAGASGKSTIFKQMKILNMSGYTDEEKADYRPLIHRNCYEIFISMIEFCEEQVDVNDNEDYKLDSAHDDIVKKIVETMEETQTPILASDMVKPLKSLFEKEMNIIYMILQNSKDKNMLFTNKFSYIGKLDEIAKIDYIPTVDDILRSRAKTVGIVEQNFFYNDNKILMVSFINKEKINTVFDRLINERRKWIHAFDGVTFVIFIAALSEYDQACDEDPDTDRMTEALNLFRDICKDKGFKKKPFILFLNKFDVFQQKIKKVDLNVCPSFEEYTGGLDEDKAYKTIEEAFLALNKSKRRAVVPTKTTATDTTLVKQVFNQCFAQVLKKVLEEQNL
eukprot:gene8585-410_t